MARDNRVRMPSSGAGLTSFSEESRSLVNLKPMHVIVLIVLVIVIEIFLYTQGGSIFGMG